MRSEGGGHVPGSTPDTCSAMSPETSLPHFLSEKNQFELKSLS